MDEVRNMKKLSVCILPLLLLSACAVLDVTIQETAVPLPEGKVEVVAYTGSGIELYDLNPDNPPEGNVDTGWYLAGIKFGIPLCERIDLNSRIYSTGSITGVKIGPKLVFGGKKGHYLAAIPAVSGLVSHHRGSSSRRYSSLGGDLTLASSWAKNPRVVPTLSAHVSYDHIFEDISSPIPSKTNYDLLRTGFATNLMLSYKSIFLRPELGIEYMPLRDDGLKFFPTFSLGLGFQQ